MPWHGTNSAKSTNNNDVQVRRTMVLPEGTVPVSLLRVARTYIVYAPPTRAKASRITRHERYFMPHTARGAAAGSG